MSQTRRVYYGRRIKCGTSYFVPHEDVPIKSKPLSNWEQQEYKARQCYDEGNQYYDKGFYDDALSAYNQGLNYINGHNHPVQGWLHTIKAIVCNILGQHQEAIDCLKQVSFYHDYNGSDWCIFGTAYKGLNNYTKALECYEHASGFNDTREEAAEEVARIKEILRPKPVISKSSAWEKKAAACLRSNDYDGAIKYYNKIAVKYPLNHYTWKQKANAFNKLERYEEAIDCCDQALSFNVSPPYTLRYKGIALSGLGRYEEALQCFDMALSGEFGEPHLIAWLSKAETLVKMKQYYNAFECYEKALLINSECQDAKEGKDTIFEKANELSDKGQSLYHGGNYLKALECYNEALKFYPNDSEIWHLKGKVMYALNRYEEELSCYDSALVYAPDNYALWNSRGHVFLKLNDCEQALFSFDKALAFAPYDLDAKRCKDDASKKADEFFKLCNEGDDYAFHKNITAALVCYEKVLNINPNFKAALHRKAFHLNSLLRFNDAMTCCDRLLLLDNQDKAAWKMKGSALVGLKEYEYAITYFDHALYIDPSYHEALAGKGYALMHAGNSVAAIMSLKKALLIDANVEYAKLGLAEAISQYKNKRQDQETSLREGIDLEDKNCLNSALKRYNEGLGSAAHEYHCVLMLSPELIHEALQANKDELIATLYNDQVVIYWSNNGENINECEILTRDDSRKIIQYLPDVHGIVYSKNVINMIVSACADWYSHSHDHALWSAKARALYKTNAYEEAIVCCNKALAISSNNTSDWLTKARALKALGRYTDSITCYERVLQLDPSMTCAQNEKEEALQNYKQKIQKENQIQIESLMCRAKQLYLANNTLDAIECYNKALTIDINDPSIWIEKSFYLTQIGNYDEAIACCDQALLIDSNWQAVLTQRNIATTQMYQFQHLRESITNKVKNYKKNLSDNIESATFMSYTLFRNVSLYNDKITMADSLIVELQATHTVLEIAQLLETYLEKDKKLCRDYGIETNIFSNQLLRGAQQEVANTLNINSYQYPDNNIGRQNA